MKNLLVTSLALIIFTLGAAFAQEKEREQVQEQVKAQDVKDEIPDSVVSVQQELNTICPVSNEEADPEVTYAYEGKTYSLCCNKCLKKFKADPEKYISRLEKKKPEDQPLK